MISNIEFKNLDELYNRVLPALYTKVKELKRNGYNLVNEKDIWNYLVENSWKKRNDLELNDLVNEILYLDNYEINNYVVEKLKRIKSNIDKKDENNL